MNFNRPPDESPDDLSALDAELRGLTARSPIPSLALRSRVLAAIDQQRHSAKPRLSPWALAAAIAAALLWINLSLSLVHDEGRNWPRSAVPPGLAAVEREIRGIAPELGSQAAGYAITLWAGSRLPRTASDCRGAVTWEAVK